MCTSRSILLLQVVLVALMSSLSGAFLVALPTSTRAPPQVVAVVVSPSSRAWSEASKSGTASGPASSEKEEEEVVRGPCPNFPKCSGDSLKSGCDGNGKIKGGIGTMPGMGWLPIKAYRPCPSLLEAGYGYRREGQTFGEFVEGKLPRSAREESKKLKQKAAKEAKDGGQ